VIGLGVLAPVAGTTASRSARQVPETPGDAGKPGDPAAGNMQGTT